MKKNFRSLLGSLIITAFLISMGLGAKAQVFDQGDKVISLGIGLGSNYIGWGSYYKTSVPPIFVAGDYCLKEDLGPGNLGVGALLGYSAYKYDVNVYDWGYKSSLIFFGVRGSYHFVDLVDKLDLYAGILLGGKIYTYKYYGGYDAHNAGFHVASEFFAGARYYFTDNFAAMAELGYGIAWLKLGVSLRF
jgi:hypothetical protein